MEEQNEKKKKTKTKIIIVVIILLLLALLAISGAYYFMDNKEEPANENINKTTTNQSQPIVEENDQEDEFQKIRDEWETKLTWDETCNDVDPDLYGAGVYEYALGNNEKILLILCRVGGTSNTYLLYHYNEETEIAGRLTIQMHEAGTSGVQLGQYDRFASIEDYSNFSETGSTLRIYDHSNGQPTCGLDATYEWSNLGKNYNLKTAKGNLYCDNPIAEENWPTL